jgi:lariat debranching enzyme
MFFLDFRYYSGEKVAPILTIFIGGNHEGSNYLQELAYGGWVAPNIYYLGYAGVITANGVRIGGISGIFNRYNYKKGHYEIAPYSENTKRSVYHIRSLEVFRLKQLTPKIDVMLSHDWPMNITDHGNAEQLMRFKPNFREDIENNRLGSPPCQDLLMELKPKHWFSAHLHCKFTAQVKHGEDQITDFIALDKCIPNRKFLEIVEIGEPVDVEKGVELSYDLEWLAILYLTNGLVNYQSYNTRLPQNYEATRWNFTPTEEEKQAILKKFEGDLKIPKNFVRTVPPFNPAVESLDDLKYTDLPKPQVNDQTTIFCEKLGVDDPIYLMSFLHADWDSQ